jgi:hypothetical protein
VDDDVYRGFISAEEAKLLRAQKGNFLLGSEDSCFIRGNFSKPAILHFGTTGLFGDLPYFAAKESLDMLNECAAPK